MQKEQDINNPLVVRCGNCGGDLHFDIAKQRYCCAHCGSEFEATEKKAQYRSWKTLQHDTVMKDADGVKAFSCPACGAKTVVSGDNVTAQCPFCQNTMIDAQFDTDTLPEVVVPFKLSRQEAKAKLREWLQKNAKRPEAKSIEAHMEHFAGCYLPYQIVRGAYNSQLAIRSTTEPSPYPFRAYLSHTAVNASSDLNNIFLDGVEPFDFSEARAFDFGYLNHQNAKVQNVFGEELLQRIGEETQEELYETFAKKVHTKELSIDLDGDNTPESIAALLPVYLVNCPDGIAAAVNGQTGKVSIDTGKKKDLTRYWWVWPALATLVVAVVAGIFGGWGLAFGFAALFGVVFFAVQHTRHDKHIVQGVITYPKIKKGEETDVKAEFFADFGEGPVPAKLKFFTPWRIIKWVLGVLVFIFLPVFIAAPIQLMRGLPLTDMQLGYGAAWYCIPGFVAIFMAGGMAKNMMYGSPLYYEIKPNGKTRRRRLASQKRVTFKEALANAKKLDIGGKEGCFIIGLMLFMLIGSAMAMIF